MFVLYMLTSTKILQSAKTFCIRFGCHNCATLMYGFTSGNQDRKIATRGNKEKKKKGKKKLKKKVIFYVFLCCSDSMCWTVADWKIAGASTWLGTTGSTHSLILSCIHICKKQKQITPSTCHTHCELDCALQQMGGHKFHLDPWSAEIFYSCSYSRLDNSCKKAFNPFWNPLTTFAFMILCFI